MGEGIAETSLNKEVIDIFSKWSKSAVVNCLQSNGINIDLSNNKTLDQSLDRCLNEVVEELISHIEEWRLHQRALVK